MPHIASDMSLSDVANDSVMLSTNEGTFLKSPTSPNHAEFNQFTDFHAPSTFTTHRRMNSLPVIMRPRAQSHTSLPRSRVHSSSPNVSSNQNRVPQPMSPLQQRRAISSLNHSINLMSTPPPNRALARQLKLKGSVTDPAQPRRREAFGSVRLRIMTVTLN